MYQLGHWNVEALEREAERLKNGCKEHRKLIDTLCLLRLAYRKRLETFSLNGRNPLHSRTLLVMKLIDLEREEDGLDFGGEQLLCMHTIETLLNPENPSIHHPGAAIDSFRRMVKKVTRARQWEIVEERFLQLTKSKISSRLLKKVRRIIDKAKARRYLEI